MGQRCLLTKMYPFPQLLASPTAGRLGPSCRRLDLVPEPRARLVAAGPHVQAPAMLPCRDDAQVSSSGRASVAGL